MPRDSGGSGGSQISLRKDRLKGAAKKTARSGRSRSSNRSSSRSSRTKR